jgi:hypothetical protein
MLHLEQSLRFFSRDTENIDEIIEPGNNIVLVSQNSSSPTLVQQAELTLYLSQCAFWPPQTLARTALVPESVAWEILFSPAL